MTAEPRGSLFKFLLVGELGSAVKTYLPLSNAHSDVMFLLVISSITMLVYPLFFSWKVSSLQNLNLQ